MEIIILIIGLLISVVFHELAHGIAADKLGDDTPRLAGRLTLNPIAHLDFIGSLLLPTLSYLSAGFIFGWAKPVPINPFNFKNPKRDMAIVAIMGPIANILIALILLSLLKITLILDIPVNTNFVLNFVRLNILLAVFNLLPIPPLDGSRIFLYFLPTSTQIYLEQFGFILIIFFIFFAFWIISGIVNFLLNLILKIFNI